MYALYYFELSGDLDYDPDPIELFRGEWAEYCFRHPEVVGKTWESDGDCWQTVERFHKSGDRFDGLYAINWTED